MKKLWILWICLLIGFKTFANIAEPEINSKTQGFESQFSALSQNYLDNTPYKQQLLRVAQLWQFCQEKRSEYFNKDWLAKDVAEKIIECHDFANQEITQMIEDIKKDPSSSIKKQEALKILETHRGSTNDDAVKLLEDGKTEKDKLFSLRTVFAIDNMALDYYYKAVQLFVHFDVSKGDDLASVVERLEKEFTNSDFAYDTQNIIPLKTREFISNNPFKEDYSRLTYTLLDCYNRQETKSQVDCYSGLWYEFYKQYKLTNQKPTSVFSGDEKHMEGNEPNMHAFYELRLILDALMYKQSPCKKLIDDKKDEKEIVTCFNTYVLQSLTDLQKIQYLYEGQPPLPENVLNNLENHGYKVFFYNVAHMISEALQEQDLEKKATLAENTRDFIKDEQLFKLYDAKQTNDFRQHIAQIPKEIKKCQKPFDKKPETLGELVSIPELNAKCFDDFAHLYLSDPFQFNAGLWMKTEGIIAVEATDLISYSPKDKAWGDGVPLVLQNTLLGMACIDNTTILYIKRESGDISFGNIIFTEPKKVTFVLEDKSYEHFMVPFGDGQYLILGPGKRSIPFIKQLMDKDYVNVSFPEPQSPQGKVEQEYILTGLSDAIKDIQNQCRW